MVKVFDLEPGGLKDGGQAKLNKEESAKFNKEQEIRKEHEETNRCYTVSDCRGHRADDSVVPARGGTLVSLP